MKTIPLMVALFALSSTSARAQSKALSNDPLTGLPIIPTTVSKFGGNEPTKIPDYTMCKSRMQANMYTLMSYMFTDHYDKTKATVSSTVAWYASRLTGFRKVVGFDGKRSQNSFSNADGTVVVMVTGNAGAKGADTDAYGVTYYRFQPGLSQKSIVGMAQGNTICG